MKETLKKAKIIVSSLQQQGYIAYFAGGYVRDFLMGHASDDIDIATNASIKEIQSLFDKTIPVGIAFGIIIVVLDEHQFEVATFRKDKKYVDGRRPLGIEPATPQEDAKRRDFTINGLFLDPLTNQIHDFVGGQEDIKKRIIRAVGDPIERFSEDRLRMMRAVRYSTRFNFSIEKKTIEAIQQYAKDLLPSVSIERIWQEFKKMSSFAHFDQGLLLLHKLGLLQVIFPQLKEIDAKEIQWRVRFIKKFPNDSPTFAELLELFPKINLEEIENLANFLKLSNKEKAFTKFYHHASNLLSMPSDWLEKLEKAEWAYFYADPHADIGLEMLSAKQKDPKTFLHDQEKRKRSLAPHITRIQNKNPYLRAHHLKEAGVKPGENMGTLLQEGMRIAINEEITDSQQLIKKLQRTSLW